MTPTGRTRKTLQIAIFYDMEALPFSNYDFSRISIDELWTESKSFRKPIDFSKEIMDGVLTLEVNGVQELPRRYRLMRMFSVDVDQDDMGPGIYKSGCTLLEFDLYEMTASSPRRASADITPCALRSPSAIARTTSGLSRRCSMRADGVGRYLASPIRSRSCSTATASRPAASRAALRVARI